MRSVSHSLSLDFNFGRSVSCENVVRWPSQRHITSKAILGPRFRLVCPRSTAIRQGDSPRGAPSTTLDRARGSHDRASESRSLLYFSASVSHSPRFSSIASISRAFSSRLPLSFSSTKPLDPYSVTLRFLSLPRPVGGNFRKVLRCATTRRPRARFAIELSNRSSSLDRPAVVSSPLTARGLRFVKCDEMC